MHGEHEAMRHAGFSETHFRVTIVSDAFAGKMAVQRHRMVYGHLGDEFATHGLHAVNIVARTPAEYDAAATSSAGPQ